MLVELFSKRSSRSCGWQKSTTTTQDVCCGCGFLIEFINEYCGGILFCRARFGEWKLNVSIDSLGWEGKGRERLMLKATGNQNAAMDDEYETAPASSNFTSMQCSCHGGVWLLPSKGVFGYRYQSILKKGVWLLLLSTESCT
nr:hypothetical protein [Tanacetum cinerariifolium]